VSVPSSSYVCFLSNFTLFLLNRERKAYDSTERQTPWMHATSHVFYTFNKRCRVKNTISFSFHSSLIPLTNCDVFFFFGRLQPVAHPKRPTDTRHVSSPFTRGRQERLKRPWGAETTAGGGLGANAAGCI
jgi:hypothetical protein